MEFEENSQKLVYGSKFNVRMATFLGERTLIDMLFGNIYYGTQNGTPMVPKVYNGTQKGTQVLHMLLDTFQTPKCVKISTSTIPTPFPKTAPLFHIRNHISYCSFFYS